MENLVYKPQRKDNTNWSKRILGNDDKLVNILHINLIQNIKIGKPLKEIINNVAEKFYIEKNIASRLIMTESVAYHSKSKEKCMRDLDYEKYEVIVILHERTSSILELWIVKYLIWKIIKLGLLPYLCILQNCYNLLL